MVTADFAVSEMKKPSLSTGLLNLLAERTGRWTQSSSSTRDCRQGPSCQWQVAALSAAPCFLIPFANARKQKGLPDREGLKINGGADGTRTRDPRRDRPVF